MKIFSALEFSCIQDTVSISGLSWTNVSQLIVENIEIALLLGGWGFQAGGGVIENFSNYLKTKSLVISLRNLCHRCFIYDFK
jgi:hypothetical protein